MSRAIDEEAVRAAVLASNPPIPRFWEDEAAAGRLLLDGMLQLPNATVTLEVAPGNGKAILSIAIQNEALGLARQIRILLARSSSQGFTPEDRDGLFLSLMAEAKATNRRPGWVIWRMKDLLGPGCTFPQALWKAHVTGARGDWVWRE